MITRNTAKKRTRPPVARKAPAPGTILFERGSAEVRPSEKMKLRSLTVRLRRNPDATVVIRGNTVGRGDDAYNRTLGQERADAVACELLRLGIAPRRIMAFSVGRKREFHALGAAERQLRRRAALTVYGGSVTELRYPALLMELQVGQRIAARAMARAVNQSYGKIPISR
jgi:outer membrane protein OmpA-like peptidoglycan-associated protein